MQSASVNSATPVAVAWDPGGDACAGSSESSVAGKQAVRVLWGAPGWSRSSPIAAAWRPRSTPSGWTISSIGMLPIWMRAPTRPTTFAFASCRKAIARRRSFPSSDRCGARGA